MVVWGKNRQGGAALWAAESRPPHSGAALLRRTSVLSQRLKTLAQAIVKHNSRPFWAAPRVRRKFGVQRRIAQGVFISPEQFNFLRYPEKRTTPYGVVLFSGGAGEPCVEHAGLYCRQVCVLELRAFVPENQLCRISIAVEVVEPEPSATEPATVESA